MYEIVTMVIACDVCDRKIAIEITGAYLGTYKTDEEKELRDAGWEINLSGTHFCADCKKELEEYLPNLSNTAMGAEYVLIAAARNKEKMEVEDGRVRIRTS